MKALLDGEICSILAQVATLPSSDLESEELEFKGYRDEKALLNAKDLSDELSALANKRGGTIVVGVKAENDVSFGKWADQLVGIPPVDVAELKERLVGRLKPRVDLSVRNLPYGGQNFAVIGILHPQDTLVSTSAGKTYIREGRSSRPMEPNEIERAVKSLVAYDWSADTLDLNPNTVLDHDSVQAALADFRFKRKRMKPAPTVNAFLEAIGATRNGLLLKGGLLFLGKAEEIVRHLGDFEYRFSWKLSTGKLKVNDVWSSNLWQAIARAKDHFHECNTTQSYTYKGKPFKVPLLDETAFHEAYLNALVHRDYSADGMTSVNFTGGKMIITSPGQFYGGVTAENIAIHEPRHRNKAARAYSDDASACGPRGYGRLAHGDRIPTLRTKLSKIPRSAGFH